MLEEFANQKSASPWLKHLLSLDDNHWTNSLTLWMSLNIADMAITWLCLGRGALARSYCPKCRAGARYIALRKSEEVNEGAS
jgi:hypothetical protein